MVRTDDLATRCPRLYHMAEDGSLPSIERYGLLSTTALLDLFEVGEPDRSVIETSWRPESIVIHHATHGRAVIRDQKPMRPSALEKSLTNGLGASDWYRFLNGKVFFWPTAKRVETLLMARAYRHRANLVITVDTTSLLSDNSLVVSVSPINSGSALYAPRPRSFESFLPVNRHRELGTVAEVAVEYGVPDVMRHVITIERRQADRVIERLR